MQTYQTDFLDIAVDMGALKFGEFTLKSGRVSPYFFNAGSLNTGRALDTLGRCYAAAIAASGIEFDLLFGPAYKGIPLAALVAAALYRDHGRNVAYAFNRKETKDHGEGGNIVGATLTGRVLIVDDVITAGTAIREAVDIIHTGGAEPVAVAIALDREELGQGRLSAVQEVEQQLGLDVVHIVGLTDLIAYLQQKGLGGDVAAMQRYGAKYGIQNA
ncbi:MAG: orotate phosphoribosyltransferase [Gammaproteobacteria bacterium]